MFEYQVCLDIKFISRAVPKLHGILLSKDTYVLELLESFIYKATG